MFKSKTSDNIFDGFFTDETLTAKSAHLLGRKKELVGHMKVHKRRFKRIMALLAALAIGAAGLAVGLMFMPKGGVSVNDGYASVAYEVEEGETFSPDKGYTGLDVFGRLNWTFAHKTDWYGDMHGAVHTTVEQDIRTYKQFHDGVLISADITKSSLVNSARQFCYVPAEDRVVWREAACSPSEYKGFDTEWKTGAPTGNMTISGPDGFRAKNGLPATELSVYIFREETVLSAEPAKTNSDGTYTITYTLDPNLYTQDDGSSTGSVAYYANQMMFSGGLTAKPEFTSVKVSYTFNDKWEVLRCDTQEEYSATMGFTVGCKAEATTYYSYDVSNPPFEETDAYDSYFNEYVSKPATGVEEAPLDSMSALTSAFGKVIAEPTTLSLDLTINDKPVEGLVYVDLHNGGSIADISLDKIEIRAALGGLDIWLDGGAAYVAAGEWKLKLTISQFTSILSEIMSADEGASIDTEALLQELMGGPLTIDGGNANMHSEIELAGLNIPLDFNYFIDEEQNVTLDNVSTVITAKDLTLSARLAYSDEAAPEALGDKSEYIELSDYISAVLDIALADALHADINYVNDDLGIAISGGADIKIKDGIAAKISAQIVYDGVQKNLDAAFDGQEVYIDVDGVKLKANVAEAMEFISGFVEIPELSLDGFDLAGLIDKLLFTPVLTDNISITQTQAEEMSTLDIALKGTELLKAFDIDFKLGDVSLKVSDGKINATAIGAELEITATTPFTVETSGYTEIAGYAQQIADIVKSGNVAVAVTYSGYGVEASGNLKVDIKQLVVSGNVNLKYKGVEKTLGIIYKDKAAYLTLDGLKVSANVDEVVSLVKSLLPKTDNSNSELSLDSIISKVLGLNFSDYITISDSDNTLTLAVKGTELLKAFDIDFELGDVSLKVSDGKINATAIGAELEITATTPFTVETTGYTEIAGYAQQIADIVKSGNVAVAVTYSGYGVEASGNLKVDIKQLVVSGNVNLKYKGVEKNLGVIYKDKVAYLTLDGLKVSANVDEVVSLVKSLLPKADNSNSELSLDSIISKVLGLNFSDYITISDSDNTLTLAVKGTELLKAFDIDFNLGSVDLKVSDGKINATAIGAQIEVSATTPFTVETEGYTEIAGYAQQIADIVKSGNVAVAVTYSGYGVEASGDLKVDIKQLVVSGNVNLKYKGVEKNLGVIYKDKVAYLTLDGLKVSANVDEVVSLVKSLLPKTDNANSEFSLDSIIPKVLGLNFGDYITISDSDNTLTLAVKGTELLKAFDIDFNLGSVDLKVSDGKINATAIGAQIEVSATTPFTVETTGYKPLGGILAKVPELVGAESLKIEGGISLAFKDKNISLTINGGYISWKDGIEAVLDVTLGEYGNIKARITSSDVQLAYGDVGVELAFGEFATLEETLFKAYAQLRDAVTGVIGSAEQNPLPELGGIEDILGLLSDGSKASGILSGILGGDENKDDDGFDFVSLINKATIEQGGDGALVLITLDGIRVELFDDTQNGGFVVVNLKYVGDGIEINADLGADVFADEMPAMPEIEYLGVEELDGLLGYIAAAVNTLTANDITLNLTGTIGSSEEKYEAADGIKYNLGAEISYHSPNGLPVHLNLNGKSVVIDSTAFVKAGLSLEAALPEENSLYLEMYVFDKPDHADENGANVGDGVLDFVVKLSKFKDEESAAAAGAAFKPLVFEAPADEIMTLLSGAMLLFGVDNEIINDYLVTKWITDPAIAERFTALGSELVPLISGLVGFDLSGIADLINGNKDAATPAAADLENAGNNMRGEILKSLKYKDGNATIKVALGAILGSDIGDIELELGRETGENPRLTALSLINFKTGKTTVDLAAGLGYDEVQVSAPSADYDFKGVDELLVTLANSIVHKETASSGEVLSGEPEAKYIVNRNFYITGTVQASLLSIFKVKIELVAISVNIDESGDIGINIRLKYNKIILVNNGAATLDITIKDNMVYMKRDSGSVVYRAMPLENFMSGMLNQLGFMLNFSDMINDQINGAETTPSTTPQGEEQVKDYGTILSEVLKEFSYSENDGKDVWHLKINGETFSNGILADLAVDISTDENKLVKGLNVTECRIQIPISSTSNLPLDLTLDLTWHNPGGVSDGSDDVTDPNLANVAGNAANGMGGMIEKLNKQGWGEKQFLEAETGNVEYYSRTLEGAETHIGGQGNVMLSTGDDGNAKGTVYSALDYPQLPEDMRSHYVWDGAVSNGKLYANEVLKSYEVTFLSDDYIDGWDFDEDYDCYKFVASMLYGSRVEFIASGSEYADSKTITENTTIKLPALPSYKGDSSYDSLLNRDVSAAVSENGARITVHYSAEIKYHSDLAFEAQGVTSQDHTLVTSEKDGLYSPAVSGYTFLGWYLNTESGWRKVETPDFSDMELLEGTLEALWVRDDGIQITKHEKSYNWKKAHDEYVVETAFDNNAIIGAFANDEHNISVLYAYDFQGGNSNYYDFSSSSTCNSTSKFGQPNKTLVVSFKFTVTVGGQAFEYIVTRTASF